MCNIRTGSPADPPWPLNLVSACIVLRFTHDQLAQARPNQCFRCMAVRRGWVTRLASGLCRLQGSPLIRQVVQPPPVVQTLRPPCSRSAPQAR